MALVLKDRVKETTNTSGTGTLTLLGATTGYQSFSSAIGNGNTTYYAISATGSALWEVGLGTVAAGTLARTTILASSSGGTAITLPGTTFDVFVTYPATKSVYGDNSARGNALITGYTSTPTATGNTILDVNSSMYQIFTGSLAQTVTLPVTSTLFTGWTFHICNNSTGTLTVNSSGGNLVFSVPSGVTVMCTCIGTTLTTAADWEAGATDFSTITGTGSAVLSSTPTITDLNLAAGTFTSNITALAADPATPAAGTIYSYAKSIAGKLTPKWKGPTGIDQATQSLIGQNKVAWWNAWGQNNTAPTLIGFSTAFSTQGTATARVVATTNLFTRVKRLGYVSAATAGSLAGHYDTIAQHTTGAGGTPGVGGFFYVCRFGISDPATVAGARMFVGMSSTVAAPTNVEPNTLLNSVGIAQLSTDATQLYIVYGGSAAQTAIALGTNFPPTAVSAVWYELALFAPPTGANVGYKVTNLTTGNETSGTLTGTSGTQFPASTTLLAHRTYRTNNATALAVGLDIGSVYIETDD